MKPRTVYIVVEINTDAKLKDIKSLTPEMLGGLGSVKQVNVTVAQPVKSKP